MKATYTPSGGRWGYGFVFYFGAILGVFALCSCYKKPAYTGRYDDFFASAKSNAFLFKVPPDGYSIMCDGHGHYVPARNNEPYDMKRFVAPTDGLIPSGSVRTDKMECLIICWKIYEIDHFYTRHPVRVREHETSLPNANWKECK